MWILIAFQSLDLTTVFSLSFLSHYPLYLSFSLSLFHILSPSHSLSHPLLSPYLLPCLPLLSLSAPSFNDCHRTSSGSGTAWATPARTGVCTTCRWAKGRRKWRRRPFRSPPERATGSSCRSDIQVPLLCTYHTRIGRKRLCIKKNITNTKNSSIQKWFIYFHRTFIWWGSGFRSWRRSWRPTRTELTKNTGSSWALSQQANPRTTFCHKSVSYYVFCLFIIWFSPFIGYPCVCLIPFYVFSFWSSCLLVVHYMQFCFACRMCFGHYV